MTGNENPPSDDPWEGVVFDEEFVRGGRHEPPARTRESIARYGGRRTSWRQGALLEPVSTKRRSRRRRRSWLIGAAVVGAMALAVFMIIRVPSAPEIAAVAAPSVGPPIAVPSSTDAASSLTSSAEAQLQTVEATTVAADTSSGESELPSTATTTTEVFGVSEFDAVGTCYLDPLTGGGGVQLTTVDCTAGHNLELVSHRTATDDAATYPDADYWDTVVGDACEDDLTAYLGEPPSAWPAELSPYWVFPLEESWAFGDRHIYCMFHTDGIVTAPVLG